LRARKESHVNLTHLGTAKQTFSAKSNYNKVTISEWFLHQPSL